MTVYKETNHCYSCLGDIEVEVDESKSGEEGQVLVKCKECGTPNVINFLIVKYMALSFGHPVEETESYSLR